MAHQVLMESIRAVPMEELPLINWKEAAAAVNGDESADEAFLLELLATFYTETIPRLVKMLNAAVEYRHDKYKMMKWPGDVETRSIERVIKDEAHAIKGSSANIRLWRLAKAAEAVELPCKRLVGREPYDKDDADRIRLLNEYCISPCTELKTLLTQFRAFVEYMQNEVPKQVDPSFDMARDLEPEAYAELQTVTLKHFDEKVSKPCAAFWEASPPNLEVASTSAAAAECSVEKAAMGDMRNSMLSHAHPDGVKLTVPSVQSTQSGDVAPTTASPMNKLAIGKAPAVSIHAPTDPQPASARSEPPQPAAPTPTVTPFPPTAPAKPTPASS